MTEISKDEVELAYDKAVDEIDPFIEKLRTKQNKRAKDLQGLRASMSSGWGAQIDDLESNPEIPIEFDAHDRGGVMQALLTLFCSISDHGEDPVDQIAKYLKLGGRNESQHLVVSHCSRVMASELGIAHEVEEALKAKLAADERQI